VLAAYFPADIDYWNGKPRPCDPEGLYELNTDWRSWTFEIRFYEGQSIHERAAWCADEPPWKHFEGFSMRRDRHRLVTRRHPSNGSFKVRPRSSPRERRGSASGWNTGFVNRLTYDRVNLIRSGDRRSQRSPVGGVRPFAAGCAAEVGRDVQSSQDGGGSCSSLLAR